MSRQHASPLLIDTATQTSTALEPLPLTACDGQISEAELQAFVQAHPSCLPIAEIDAIFAHPVPICTELNIPMTGSIDNFMVTAGGLPVLAECKLWRNAQSRREVVGQILDYAKALSRWSAADVQAAVRRRLGRNDDPVPAIVRAAGHMIDDRDFNDALSANLRRGRFLLLIVGDGIREGVETIAQYLQLHAGLHFSFGLVELPLFLMPDGNRLVLPRVVARTEVARRVVVDAPANLQISDANADLADSVDAGPDEMTADRIRFWTSFVDGLRFDEPDQPTPNVSKQGYVYLLTPVPGGSLWITVFRSVRDSRVGLFLSYHRNSPGERIARLLNEDFAAIRAELGGNVSLRSDNIGRQLIQDDLTVPSLTTPHDRDTAINWLRQRSNEFVNALRPRIKNALADLDEGGA